MALGLGASSLALGAASCDGAGGGAGDARSEPADLSGTAWVAEDIERRGVLDVLQSTLVFGDDGVHGNAGCNQYRGTSWVDGDRLSMSGFATTRKMCPESVMDQEQRFLRALEGARRWKIERGLLFLYGEDAGGEALLRLSRLESLPE